ncbi:MAG: hypothetical protein AB7H77_09310 [Bdellovibrionales bacterium]
MQAIKKMSGAQMKKQRLEMGLSETEYGVELGKTPYGPEQKRSRAMIQCYERGTNQRGVAVDIPVSVALAADHIYQNKKPAKKAKKNG